MSEKDEKDESKDIDWTKATDEQLAAAAAEMNRRRPLTEFEGMPWGQMTAADLEQNSRKVFAAQKAHSAAQRLEQQHAEFQAEKAAREAKKANAAA